MPIENRSFKQVPKIESNKEDLRREILERLRLYHQTTREKWEKIQEAGAILSEKELLKRGLISKDQLDDFETTSTGSLDREVGRDGFVFASTSPAGYGEVTLEIDLDALQIPGAKVSTAGEWLMHVNEEDRDFFNNAEIPANEFVSYLVDFLPTLPKKEWFWKSDSDLEKFLGEAMMEKTYKNDKTKFRTFWRLHPEIIFPKELPLKYIKKVIIDSKDKNNNG